MIASQFRLSDALSMGFGALSANPRIVLPYLGIAVMLPFMVFSAFPQASMRNFLALSVNPGTYLVDGSPLTILSIFLVAVFTIAAVLFACWQALLARSRDGMVGEFMYGFVAALLSMLVALGIYMVWSLFMGALALVAVGVATPDALALPARAARAYLIIALPGWLFLLWLNARLCLSGPAMAASESINPFAGMAQSWRTTAPVQWRVMAYLFAFQLLGLGLVGGVFAATTALIVGSDGTSWHDWVVTLAWLLTTMALTALFIAVPLGLHRSLSDEVDADVFA